MIKNFLFNLYMKCCAFKAVGKELFLIKKASTTERDILLLCHALEKGMSMPNYTAGRGKEKAEQLDMLLSMADGNSESYYISEGKAVLNAYLKIQRSAGLELNYQSISGGGTSLRKLAAGTAKIPEGSFCDSYNQMSEFFFKRHSIRCYKKATIDKSIIDKIIEIAKTAPSACNRQVTKVYYSCESQWNNYVGELVPGNKGFQQNIYNYFVVTTRRDLFGENEFLQWYVNGGIFLGYLSMAIHSVGLGSCIFQWPIANKNDDRLKKYLGIPATEAVVAVVSYGIPESTGKILEAARRNTDEIGVECFLKQNSEKD